MTQYMATKTHNLLVERTGQFYHRGTHFLGLVDEAANALYDHPDDSFNNYLGLPTALAEGLIVPVEGNKTDWKDFFKDWLPTIPTSIRPLQFA